MKSKLDTTTGFTLLEVMIAVVVLSIGVIAVYAMQMTSITGNAAANQLTASTNTAAIIVEEIVNMPYNSANYDFDIDTDGDGIIDTDLATFTDGLGSNNNQAGLNDITDPGAGTTSDYTTAITTNGGNFTLDINVARNYPDNGMDTIRVIIRNNTGFGNRVSFSTIKSSI
ncbi:MAG: prepilin-type N-terminal cleavage/methylation domain-containing protein [Proteobacteria bacterium]|nr:prepilin-type N-terminal cleavage/methylation domain-containing protein [Pseudomonadota bacterium]